MPQKFQQTTVHNVALIPNYFSSAEEEGERNRTMQVREVKDESSEEESDSSEEERKRKEAKKEKKREKK